MSKSAKVSPFLFVPSDPLVGAKVFARASIPRSYASQWGIVFDVFVISRSIDSYRAPYSS